MATVKKQGNGYKLPFPADTTHPVNRFVGT